MNETLIQIIQFMQEKSFLDYQQGIWLTIILLLLALYAEEKSYTKLFLLSFLFAVISLVLTVVK